MIKKLTKDLEKFNKERGWDEGLDAQDVAKSIIIEAAELLEHFQWDGSRSKRKTLEKKNKEEIGEEIADVFIYLIRLCYMMGFDIEEIIRDKMRKNAKRYPAKREK